MLPAELIAGRYEIEQLCATEGMAVVYRARDVTRDTAVAIKVMHRGDQPIDRTRFERDADRLAAVAHPAIVKHVDRGVTALGETYVVQDWIEAPTLKQRLASGALPVREAVSIVRTAAAAVGAAHAAGVLHRGLEPRTITAGEPVRVVDFGMALIASGPARKLTRTGIAIGTVNYTAPELLRAGAEADPRTDVFALGAILYECLAGREAFRGSTALASRARILGFDPPPLAGASPALVDVVSRMLARRPADRFADGDAVAAALGALADLPDERLASASPPAGASTFVVLTASATALLGRDRASLQRELDTACASANATGVVMDDGCAAIAGPAGFTIEGAIGVAQHLQKAWSGVPVAVATDASIDALARAVDAVTLEIAFADPDSPPDRRILVGPEVTALSGAQHDLRIHTK